MLYFDNSATTPIHPEVAEKLDYINREHYANPSSIYNQGRKAKSLIENARKPWVKVYASNSKIEDKDILKENNYRWDPGQKVWHKIITNTDIDDERIWLDDNIYNGNFSGKFIEILPVDKYKNN